MRLKKDIGALLKYYRKEAGYTQQDMSEITGLSKNHLSAVERGLYKLNMCTLLVYIKICHIPLDEFFVK